MCLLLGLSAPEFHVSMTSTFDFQRTINTTTVLFQTSSLCLYCCSLYRKGKTQGTANNQRRGDSCKMFFGGLWSGVEWDRTQPDASRWTTMTISYVLRLLCVHSLLRYRVFAPFLFSNAFHVLAVVFVFFVLPLCCCCAAAPMIFVHFYWRQLFRLSSEEEEYTTDETSDEEEEDPARQSSSISGRKSSKPPRRWQASEDRRLAESVKLHGEANWKAIASKVGSRNHVQCLQRWKKVRGAPGMFLASCWGGVMRDACVSCTLFYKQCTGFNVPTGIIFWFFFLY